MRASGPRRANSGIRSCKARYSRKESSVFIVIANSPSWTSRGVNARGAHSNVAAKVPLASTSHTRTRFPRRAASRASAAEIVVLPTPPLPVTNTSRRSNKSVTGRGALTPEAEALVLLGRRDLDVGDLGDGHADLATALVGEPQHLVVVGDEGVVDLALQLLAGGVVSQLER